MSSRSVIIMLAFVKWTHAKEMVDNLADKLLDRALSIAPVDHAGLGNAMLGKPGHLATHPPVSMRLPVPQASLTPILSRRAFSHSTSGASKLSWDVHQPQYHVMQATKSSTQSKPAEQKEKKWEVDSRKPITIWPKEEEKLDDWIAEAERMYGPNFEDSLFPVKLQGSHGPLQETRKKKPWSLWWPMLSLGTMSSNIFAPGFLSQMKRSLVPGLPKGQVSRQSPSPSKGALPLQTTSPKPSQSSAYPPSPWKKYSSEYRRRVNASEYRANVGQAIDQLREDHQLIPNVAPGLAVALPSVRMELANAEISFEGQKKYARFWGFFKNAIRIFSSDARSEVVAVYQIGSKIRVRWRLLFTARAFPPAVVAGLAAAAAVAAVTAAGEASDVVELDDAVTATMAAAATAAVGVPLSVKGNAGGLSKENVIDFNSIYDLDVWNGRISSHRLEFRTPHEDSSLIRALQWSLKSDPLLANVPIPN